MRYEKIKYWKYISYRFFYYKNLITNNINYLPHGSWYSKFFVFVVIFQLYILVRMFFGKNTLLVSDIFGEYYFGEKSQLVQTIFWWEWYFFFSTILDRIIFWRELFWWEYSFLASDILVIFLFLCECPFFKNAQFVWKIFWW